MLSLILSVQLFYVMLVGYAWNNTAWSWAYPNARVCWFRFFNYFFFTTPHLFCGEKGKQKRGGCGDLQSPLEGSRSQQDGEQSPLLQEVLPGSLAASRFAEGNPTGPGSSILSVGCSELPVLLSVLGLAGR